MGLEEDDLHIRVSPFRCDASCHPIPVDFEMKILVS